MEIAAGNTTCTLSFPILSKPAEEAKLKRNIWWNKNIGAIGIKHTIAPNGETNEHGQEYWLARELQAVLEYAQWRRFNEAIYRAKSACANSGYAVEDHFADVGKMVEIGSGAEREIEDIMLSRYACYLIVMNGDPRKEVSFFHKNGFSTA